MHLQKKLVSVLLSAVMVVSSLLVSGSQNTITSNMTTTVQAASNDTSTFDNLDQNDIVTAMGAGWNLGNQLEAVNNGYPGETNWGNPVITESLIKAVKNAGFHTIRIPVSYMGYIGNDASYTINSSWLNRVQEVVDMCIKNGLFVIINMHGDGYTTLNGSWLLCASSNQSTIKAKYGAVWKQIAARFKNYDEHLIFESMNEEFDGSYSTPNSTAYNNINNYNQLFVNTVRQAGGNNDKRWLLIPGWNTNIDYTAGNYGFQLPSDNYLSSSLSGKKRIMISVHYYSPWEFCGNESNSVTQWGSTATTSSKTASWGNESYMQTELKLMYTKFVQSGYPVVIGEYGSIDKSAYDSTNTACRAEFAKKICSYSKSYGMVPVLWDNGYNGTYGFAVFNRNTYSVTQQSIINAIMSVYTGSSSSTTTSSSPSPSPSATSSASPSPSSSTGSSTQSGSLPSGITCEYKVVSDWGSSFQGQIIIKNNSSKTYSGWTLQFNYNSTINNLWGAELSSQSGTKVIVKNPSWDSSFAPGSSVTINFTAALGSDKNEPKNYSFS